MITHYAAYVVSAAAFLAALIYIGRKVGKVAVIMQLLARLPNEHAQLLQATRENTVAIAALVGQMSQLTSDVSKLAGK